MTVLTQSSSAAIAITLTAATAGILGLYAAAAMVIGANVGTTSTAALAVIGATANAKRVAAAHIIFNVATGLVALMTLPLLFSTVNASSELQGMQNSPALTLALFHTTFNILGVMLMWPADALSGKAFCYPGGARGTSQVPRQDGCCVTGTGTACTGTGVVAYRCDCQTHVAGGFKH